MSNNFIPLSVPVLEGNEWPYLKECLDTGWISTAGPFVTRFEEAICSIYGQSLCRSVRQWHSSAPYSATIGRRKAG